MKAPRNRARILLAVAWLALLSIPAPAQDISYFRDWPPGYSPREIGKRVAERFVSSPHQYDNNPTHYSEIDTWYGALAFASITHDAGLRDELIRRFDPYLPGGPDFVPLTALRSEDLSVLGIVPLEIGMQTGNKKYLTMGKQWADRQWETPRPDGLSIETRFWIDDMYMMTILQVEAYRATGDRIYLDHAALEMSVYCDKLQQPDGLFFHTLETPFYWGRGNGWVAAGMTELLTDLPENHPRRPRILEAYRLMMAALLKYQGRDGMWRQLIDHDEAWPETSASAMFEFAMVTGVKHGWLDAKTYGPAARRGWVAVAGYIDQNYDATNVCQGTNATNSVDYYLQRKRLTGDFHGQAPILWTINALLR
ncbi:Rhamnogalacturonides degradation protein RhiN [Acidisarcina polymorpha]|uniref:Rhamnogalacturonides degradation protein RhiN n=1 Tax=Acidisarcina polymorpha TaxID=2211140 RepID=A0A2Z5G7T8_9BACT|nr:glycoside hydrolase family 88 protein [Acidisarcina polymorpha]AXC15121.1 Rhamnogalacturonides degradation protein RhiN [Acidisarcina polymorpha]